MVRQYWKEIPGTMFDFSGFYQSVAMKLPQDCRIVEVGVADGKSAIFLAEALANMNKRFHLTMIDSLDYGHTEQLTEILRNIQRSGLSEFISFLPFDSLAASCKFNDNSLHFVFIDSSHKYEQTKAEIRLWYRKVMDGYLLSGHDYLSEDNPGVKVAVDEVVPANRLKTLTTENKCGVWSVEKHPETLMK
jgi:cephalosporin hydroxylase